MKKLLILPALAGCVLWAARQPAVTLDPQHYLAHIKFLASPELRGRGTGTPELDKAAGYIAREFKRAGLAPIDGRGYYQPFPVTTNARLGKKNEFGVSDRGRKSSLKYPAEYMPFNFSSRGKLSCDVVFAGYGITAREYNYDDYAGIDVKGKCVLLLRYEPQEYDDKSVFNGKVYTGHSQFASKATNARNHGAAGVILINNRVTHKSDGEDLEPFGKSAGPTDAGIPFVQIKAEEGERWIKLAGRDVETIVKEIDAGLKPRSFALPSTLRVDANVDVERAVKTTRNVAGYLAGETDEYIVIGAHYDHLGLGDQFSLAPSLVGTPHVGADDNASGTAAVIELAKHFAAQPRQKRGILFLAFSGEELGLLGSNYYVNNPKFPLDKCAAMINMDMIGRVKDGKVYIGGSGTGSSFRALLERVIPPYSQFKVDYSDQSGYGSSDHTSFTTKQVPTLFFFSGLHSDYHKPSDTWDKIDAAGSATLLHLIADTASNLASAAERPQYVKIAPKAPTAGHGDGPAPSSSGQSGYGAYFGSIPDFGEIPTGVKFADVTAGSPAAKAGLKANDILIELGGNAVKNLYDFTYALRQHKPGETVTVKVLRDGQPMEVQVLLERRR